jgi:hypothetical protein
MVTVQYMLDSLFIKTKILVLTTGAMLALVHQRSVLNLKMSVTHF